MSTEDMTVSQEATTKMVDDGDLITSKMKMPVKLDAGLLTTASTGFLQDINTFLAKPYPLSYGTFQTTDTSGTFPQVRLLETLCALDIYFQKIKGHLGIRATVVLKIQFNAERFMQGRYILAFMPLVSTNTATGYENSSQKALQLTYNKTTVSQLPHVEFDLNCDTEATLEIPYVSPYSHYSIKDHIGEVGSYFLYPYSPLKIGTAGGTICQWTLWASLKDVELVAPTLPQMAVGKGRMRPVAMVKKRGTVTESEQTQLGIGPIESVLNKVSRAADVVAQIPVISLVASQVKWASDIVSRAAHIFGWAKPLDLDHACRMYHNYAPFWGNVDTVDMGLPLSMVSTNSLEVLPGFAGTDIDETGIDFVKTIPAYMTEFTWAKTNITEDVLYTTQLNPTLFTNVYTDAGGTILVQTPLSFLGNMFRYYKGSIRLTFKVVKTEFHSGRLLLSYSPAQTNVTGSISIADTTYLHREILDVRMGSEFSFVIPYASVQTYRETTQSYGRLQINVLNELVCPDTVSPSVQVLVEVSAAPDMEFAFPVMPKLAPYIPITIQSDFSDIPLDYQMDAGNSCVIDEGILSNGAMFDDHLSGARFCVGEKLMSLMQLLKVSCYSEASTGQIGGPGAEVQIFPWSSNVISTVSGTTVPPQTQCDWYDYIVQCYAMSRGGARIKFTETTGIAQSVFVAARLYPVSLASAALIRYNIGSPATFFDFSANNFNTLPSQYFKLGEQPVEVQVPQYGKFHSRVNSELMTNIATGTTFKGTLGTQTVPNIFLGLQNKSGLNFTAEQIAVFRGVSDDFQLGYFVGIPPMRAF